MATMTARFIFVASAILAIAIPSNAVLDWRDWSRNIGDPLAFCDKGCINKVFEKHCESMECSPQPPSPATLKKLCVDTCVRGLASKQMRRCLRKSFPKLNGGQERFQNMLLHDAYEYCEGYVVKSDAVGDEVTIPFEEVYALVQHD